MKILDVVKYTHIYLIAFSILSSFAGCSHWTNIHTKGIKAETVTSNLPASIGEIPAIFSRLQTFSNGVEVNPSEAFRARVVDNLRQSNLFAHVGTEMPYPRPDKYIELSLIARENRDTHQGATAVKGFFIGLTFFLLTPALPLKYDFSSEMQLKALRWDGESKTYEAKSSGTATYHLFANPSLAGQEVEGKVTTYNLNSLMNQMITDKSYFVTLGRNPSPAR